MIGWYVWRQSRRPGTRYFAWSVVVWFVWAAAAALQTVVSSPGLRYGLWVLQCVCALLEAPLALMFCLEYTGNEKWIARRSLYLMFLPVLILITVTYSLPNTIASLEYHSGIPVFVAGDLLKWGFYTYVMVLVFITLGVLLACLMRASAFWAPILLIMLGRIFPAVGYALLDPHRLTVSPIQVAILLATFAMLAYMVALYSFGLLRVMPVARDQVISHMPYSLIVLDAENRLVDFNTAAQSLPDLPRRPGQPAKLALRQPAFQALGSWWERLSPLIGPEPAMQDLAVRYGSQELIFRVISMPLLQASGWRMGQVYLIEDATQARRAQRQLAQSLWAQATQEEREQLADELHDGLSQSLAFLNFQAQAAQVYLQTGQSQAAQASLTRLSEAADEIQEDTRELIGSLLSVSLPADNFCDTLRQILDGFKQRTGMEVNLEITDGSEKADGMLDASACFDPARVLPSVGVQLIRITQEALVNVRKHARGARRVDVQLTTNERQLSITITDDGVGFDLTAEHEAGKHFGLQVMRQRAARVGGQIFVSSAPGKGTHIEICVPLGAPLAEVAIRSHG